jgi:hypothetical protein
VLSVPLVVPAVAPDVVDPDVIGPPLPVVPDPITDGGGDRLVVMTPAAATVRPSATLLAAQQLSEEAGRPARLRLRNRTVAAARRRRATRAIVEQRRADRSAAAAG